MRKRGWVGLVIGAYKHIIIVMILKVFSVGTKDQFVNSAWGVVENY